MSRINSNLIWYFSSCSIMGTVFGGWAAPTAYSQEESGRVVRYRTALTKLTQLQESNIYKSVPGATLVDVKQIVRQKADKVTILPATKETEANKHKLRQMVFIRHDKYLFKPRKPNDTVKTIFVIYRRKIYTPRDFERDPEEFRDREWVFSEFVAKDKLPPRFSRKDRKGNVIPKDKKNPGDMPRASGGSRPQSPKQKKAKGGKAK